MGRDDFRTLEQVKGHYEVEKELAGRLRDSSAQEKAYLYSVLCDELNLRVPLYPRLTRKMPPQDTARVTCQQFRFIRRFLSDGSVFLETGPGDCSLSFAVAQHVRSVWAVAVSAEITKNSTRPWDLQLIISDGGSTPLPSAIVHVARSGHCMEHLHSDYADDSQNWFTVDPGDEEYLAAHLSLLLTSAQLGPLPWGVGGEN